jgi:hypothetical protein
VEDAAGAVRAVLGEDNRRGSWQALDQSVVRAHLDRLLSALKGAAAGLDVLAERSRGLESC